MYKYEKIYLCCWDKRCDRYYDDFYRPAVPKFVQRFLSQHRHWYCGDKQSLSGSTFSCLRTLITIKYFLSGSEIRFWKNYFSLFWSTSCKGRRGGSFSVNSVCHLDSEVSEIILHSAVSVIFLDNVTFMSETVQLILTSYFLFMIWIPYKSCSRAFLNISHTFMFWAQKISRPLVFLLFIKHTPFFFSSRPVTLFWKCLSLRSSHDWLLLIIQKGFSWSIYLM